MQRGELGWCRLCEPVFFLRRDVGAQFQQRFPRLYQISEPIRPTPGVCANAPEIWQNGVSHEHEKANGSFGRIDC